VEIFRKPRIYLIMKMKRRRPNLKRKKCTENKLRKSKRRRVDRL
jgi:hypothetical protein